MLGRTKIEVKLTPEGSAILGKEWATLDLPADFSLRGSKDVNSLSDANKLVTDGVISFSVPFSTTNDAAFIAASSPSITDNKDTGIEARLTVDSHDWPFDRIWVRAKNDVSGVWDIDVKRSPSHWLELASKKKLHTIDCGTATLDTGVVTAWADQGYINGGAVHRWWVTDYGGWVDLNEPLQFTDPPVKRVFLEDLRPYISEVFLLKQGFCEIGWTLEGQILSSPWALAQWSYILDRLYYNQTKGGLHKLIGATLTANFVPGSLIGSPVPYDTVQYDPGTNALPAGPVFYGGITNTLPFKSKYTFCFQGNLENTGGAGNVIGFTIYEFDTATGFPSGQALYDSPIEFTLAAGATLYANFCAEIEMEVGQTAVIWIGYSGTIIVKKGYRITIEPANKSLVRGDTVTLNKMFNQDYFLLDAFKGFLHKTNARIETIWETKTVVIHPYKTTDVFGDSVPGFIKDGELPIDINSKIICDSGRLTRLKNTLLRYTRIGFADSTDAWIESQKFDEPPYSRKILNGLDLPDETTELKNPFYEPTLEGQSGTLELAKNVGNLKNKPTVYLPRLWDNTDGEKSFVIGPRSLFGYGSVSQDDETTGLKTSFFFEGGPALIQFGYASQKPTMPFHVDALPVLDATLIYGTGASDLYTTFYLGFLQRQKQAFTLDMLVLINSNDYAEYDFRKAFSFVYNGRTLKALAEKITDFAPTSETATPMQFLIEPSTTECCDLPCSCRFTECDYYQDIGQYITQDTLDELEITSFKVNGIEQLDAAADMGIIKVVELTGNHFVINLVDALNGLSIDYFTFRPSSQVYALKDDLRFFKIKYPSCWNFEIIISDLGGEVYRYRDYDQAQQWFDATWQGFGYTNEFTAPNECVTTTEY
jgi:hypothetical protein